MLLFRASEMVGADAGFACAIRDSPVRFLACGGFVERRARKNPQSRRSWAHYIFSLRRELSIERAFVVIESGIISCAKVDECVLCEGIYRSGTSCVPEV